MFIKIVFLLGGLTAVYFGWKLVSRTAYETAEYKIIDKAGNFEVREYPELLVATTSMTSSTRGNDGSFMRLFRYISGKNESSKKIEMTTPVFMETNTDSNSGEMSFVLPKKFTKAPDPANKEVKIDRRPAGRYGVIRFSGRMDPTTIEVAKRKLEEWLDSQDLASTDEYESAGYDPPITPGPFRRNEILIRLK